MAIINTIQSSLKQAQNELSKISDSPALDAELLLAHCLQKDRSYLFTWPEQTLVKTQLSCFKSLLEQRLDDIPVAYLLGKQAFWTLDLIVTPAVLIPRPETELLVEKALEKIEGIEQAKVLDLGTGSGAVALAIASERSDVHVTACDASQAALAVAKKNAEKYQLNPQITLLQSDWFSQITQNNYDLIVSNPPYIASDDPHLLQTIRHEPRQALVADDAGMSDLGIIIHEGLDYLKPEGWMLLEHGYQQASKTQALFQKRGFEHDEAFVDFGGNMRVSGAKKP